jgi:hypothetical protein
MGVAIPFVDDSAPRGSLDNVRVGSGRAHIEQHDAGEHDRNE